MGEIKKAPVAKRKGRAWPAARSGALAAHLSALVEARDSGLMKGKKEQVSFMAPRALIEAAKREAGVEAVDQVVIIALAMLAGPDPVAAFFRRNAGRLGPDHDLEY